MQDNQPNLTPAQLEIERALRSLPASRTAIDPVAAAFAAGRRSLRTTLRLFQTVCAFLLVASIAPHFLASPSRSPAPLQGGRGYATMAQHVSSPEVFPQSLLLLDQTVLAGGLDALPRSTPPAAPPTRVNNSSI